MLSNYGIHDFKVQIAVSMHQWGTKETISFKKIVTGEKYFLFQGTTGRDSLETGTLATFLSGVERRLAPVLKTIFHQWVISLVASLTLMALF